jgi:hypothetical protein
MPELGDDVADMLDEPDGAAIRRWTRTTGVKLRYAGWSDHGNTTARLIAAYAGSGSGQKLILKYIPKGRRELVEPALHTAAWDDAPLEFRARHLVEQPWPATELSEGSWMVFQNIGGRDLSRARSMSTRLNDVLANSYPVAELVASAGNAVAAAVGGWNAGGDGNGFPTAVEHLRSLLGERLKTGHPLYEWLCKRGLLDHSTAELVTTEVDGVPNPLELVLGQHPAADRRIYDFVGKSHGDLHPGNILMGSAPDQFWFIDLARYGPARPLTYDPAYLELTTVAHFLPLMKDENQRKAAVRVLLEPEDAKEVTLPSLLCELVASMYDAGVTWANGSSKGQEWRETSLLAFVAGGLIMAGRERFDAADREWFLQVAAAAAARFTALPGSAEAGPAADSRPAPSSRARPLPVVDGLRIVAPERSSLNPRTLPAVSRARLLDLALHRRDEHAKSSGERQGLALVGDGGIGKSVLLGQLLDRLETGTDHAVVLVECGNVATDAVLTDLQSVNTAFGVAADRTRGDLGLLALLEALRDAHDGVTLLVDTLDLVLSETTADGISELLSEAVGLGDVVVTCRALEFNDHLRALARLTVYPMPMLSETEILSWAEHYLQSSTVADDHLDFLQSLAGGISESGSLKQICSLPVRLALACQVFAVEGHIPENLSVTGLYQAYWEARVRGHTGHPSAVGESKAAAALEVARHVVSSVGRIAVRVPKADVPSSHQDGLKHLVSEGVLKEFPNDWEFFHQTFAEYAHGRWVLGLGVTSPELTGLVERATTGTGNVWPVVSSLLLQVPGYDDYRAVAAMVPATSAEAVKARVLGALQRPETDAVAVVLNELAERAELLPVAFQDLAHAPERHVPETFSQILEALTRHPGRLAAEAVDALVALVGRDSTGGALLRRTLSAVAMLPDSLGERRSGYLERLVEPFVRRRPSAEKLAVLKDLYPRLGLLGMRSAIRAHLRHEPREVGVIALTRTALERKCPPLGDDELVELLLVSWRNAAERRRLGWHSWREVLKTKLPEGWVNGQVKLVVRLAVEDEVLAEEVIRELLAGTPSDHQQHVNAFAQIVAAKVPEMAARLLAEPVPTAAVALNAISKCGPAFARGLDRATRLAMITWLTRARRITPRAAWPTQFTVAAEDDDVLGDLFAAIGNEDAEPAVLLGVAQAFSQHASLAALQSHALNVRDLLSRAEAARKSDAVKILKARARLEGRLAETTEDAREWVEQQVVRKASSSVASTVVKTVADAYPEGLPPETTKWLAELLQTPHNDAAERLATMLGDAAEIFGRSQPEVARAVIDAAVKRMRIALNSGESSGLHRALLDLVIRIDHQYAVDESVVWEIYRIIRSRLRAGGRAGTEPSSYYPAAMRDLGSLSGTLMADRLAPATVREMLGELLLAFDAERAGTKIGTAVESLLVSVTRRDPEAPNWLVGLFETDGAPLTIQMAIAGALLKLEGRQPGGRAEALKNSPHCPAEVVNLVVNTLES